VSRFIFKSYGFDKANSLANFVYAFDNGRTFTETVTFESSGIYNNEALERALFLAFVLIGTSYYKTFPTFEVELSVPIDEWQATFFNRVYQEGLSQFAFKNGLRRDDLAHFKATSQTPNEPIYYEGSGILALQSGGKDSLLTASLLQERGKSFMSWYVASSNHHPEILDEIGSRLAISVRSIDRSGLQKALEDGAKNGHVPVTYIIQSLAVIQAILLSKDVILVSIAHEGEESHGYIGDMAVTHQWSKTWAAELAFSDYVSRYISPDLNIGSPLRCYNELRVAELFVNHSWKKYGRDFSSCNEANYQQGNDNSVLEWCGNCPKCANSYLLFAPFIPASELNSMFDGQDLFAKSSLEHIFKGLLGIDGVSKPFECIGEIEELRLAYQRSQTNGDYQSLPFSVPDSSFDYLQIYPAQDWAVKMLQ
jgi:hypothetical protein